jgi:hypothetical protein
MNKWEQHAWWQETLEGLLPELAADGITAMVPPYKPGETPRLWVVPDDAPHMWQPLAVDLEPLRRLQQEAEARIMKRKRSNKRTRKLLENELAWRLAMTKTIGRMLTRNLPGYTGLDLAMFKLSTVVKLRRPR